MFGYAIVAESVHAAILSKMQVKYHYNAKRASRPVLACMRSPYLL